MKLAEGSTRRDHIGKLAIPGRRQADEIDSVFMDLVRILIQSAFVQDIYTRNISLGNFSRC
jgi:hypothetical protein